MEKTYNFKVSAPTEKACLDSVQAAADLVKALSTEDLIWLAKQAKEKPQLVKKARSMEAFF